jgi:hypothetical protein
MRRSQVPNGGWLVPVAPVWGGGVSNWERGSFVLFVEQLLLMHAYPLIGERTTAQRYLRPLEPSS